MSEKAEKIKKHFKENKKIYIMTSTGIIAGAASVFLLTQPNVMQARQLQILTWKSRQTVEVFVEALGDPGNIIQDTTTGIVYASQGQAARELGLPPSSVSQQLRGKKPHVKGHTFTLLGKAAVPDM